MRQSATRSSVSAVGAKKKTAEIRKWLEENSPEHLKNNELERDLSDSKAELEEALSREEQLRERIRHLLALSDREPRPEPIRPKETSDVEEAVAVAIASDWHIEERVDPAKVSNHNAFNLEIAKSRVENFFQGVVWLTKLHSTGSHTYKISTLILAILGDVITGYIHEDLRRSNFLSPTQASLFVRDRLVSGIDYLLKSLPHMKIVVPCVIGNHGRTSDKPLVDQAIENSYEWLLYNILADHYRNNPRIEFILPTGAFVYQNVYGLTIRWHHGDYVQYQGGVGGVSIPLRKAIDSWNHEQYAELNIIGHWHQMLDGNDFHVSGSLIGYNAYARRIKARWEPPRQSFFLIDKDRGKRCVSPIYVDKRFTWSWQRRRKLPR